MVLNIASNVQRLIYSVGTIKQHHQCYKGSMNFFMSPEKDIYKLNTLLYSLVYFLDNFIFTRTM